MKKNVRTLMKHLMLISVVLYLIAVLIGITNGWVPLVLLLVAGSAVTVACIEAVIHKHSMVTLIFRFVAFFLCGAGIFANQKAPVGEAACAMIAFVGVIILALMFVYYLDTQNTKDIEERLNF